MCDRSEIRFERQRRIGIFRASGQLHCGRTFVLNDASPLSAAAGWTHPFNLCASAAIFKILFLFKGLVVERSRKSGETLLHKAASA
jgi:hypothetical protein